MIDILLLLGVALCVLAVVMAVISIMRTRAPRGAAITLISGLILLIGAAWFDPRPFGVSRLCEAWTRLAGGDAFGTNTVSAPQPATAPSAEPTQ